MNKRQTFNKYLIENLDKYLLQREEKKKMRESKVDLFLVKKKRKKGKTCGTKVKGNLIWSESEENT